MLRKRSLEVHTTGEALQICVCKFDTTDVVRCQSNKPLVRFSASSFFLLTILAYTTFSWILFSEKIYLHVILEENYCLLFIELLPLSMFYR